MSKLYHLHTFNYLKVFKGFFYLREDADNKLLYILRCSQKEWDKIKPDVSLDMEKIKASVLLKKIDTKLMPEYETIFSEAKLSRIDYKPPKKKEKKTLPKECKK